MIPRILPLTCLALVISFSHLLAETIVELDPVVVVAPNILNAETMIADAQIRSAKPLDLAAILADEMPLVALSRKSPLAGDLVLRGLTRDNVQITVDQTKTFCACPNRMDPPAFHVSSQQIESISVRTGPFSVEQGGTVGGTIAVRTQSPDTEASLSTYGYTGSHGYYAGGFSASGPLTADLLGLGGFYFQRGGVYRDGKGLPFTEFSGTNYLPEHRDRTAFKVYSADARMDYSLDYGAKLSLAYGYQDARDVLYPGLRMDAVTDTMHRGSFSYRRPLDAPLADEGSASFAFSWVDHEMTDAFRMSSRMNPAFMERGYMMRTNATSGFFGLNFSAAKSFQQQHLRYGLGMQRRLWDANNVVGPNTNDMLPDVVSDTAGLYAVYEKRSGAWAFETGARLDLSNTKARESIDFVQSLQGSSTNRQTDVLPSAYFMVSRDLASRWKAYTGLGFASRSPDPQERYINLDRPMLNADWVGNPGLTPVKSLEFQGGIQYAGTKADVRLSAFYNRLGDFIYLQQLPLPGNALATSYLNIDARLYGLSFDTGYNVSPVFRLEGGLAWQRGSKRDQPVLATNSVLAEIPPLRARLSAILSLSDWDFRLSLQSQAGLNRIDPDLNERQLDGWTTLNFLTTYRFTGYLDLSFGIDNITGKTYAVSNSFVRDPFASNVIVNEPGRFLYARLSAQF